MQCEIYWSRLIYHMTSIVKNPFGRKQASCSVEPVVKTFMCAVCRQPELSYISCMGFFWSTKAAGNTVKKISVISCTQAASTFYCKFTGGIFHYNDESWRNIACKFTVHFLFFILQKMYCKFTGNISSRFIIIIKNTTRKFFNSEHLFCVTLENFTPEKNSRNSRHAIEGLMWPSSLTLYLSNSGQFLLSGENRNFKSV